MPKISIVIPTYNHLDDLLKPCLESIKTYTDLTDIEVIVVANGCTEDTREYVESLGAPFILLWLDEPSGYTKSTNEGIKIAKGEYIVLLNNDTVLLPQEKNTWINMLLEPFKDETVGITGPLKEFDNYSNDYFLIFFCVMMKRKLFDELGLLDEIFSPGGGEDTDFCIKSLKSGYKCIQVPEDLILPQGSNMLMEGKFPIYHKGEGTFDEIEEYGKYILKRNSAINLKRYNKNIKLNLGSANEHVPGYISVDKHDNRAHIIEDVCALDFEENSIEEILASHLLEHINPYKVIDLLKHWYSLLKPNGKLVMEMPDIEQICSHFSSSPKQERYGLLNCMYGSINTKDDTYGNITSPHLWGWYPEILYDHLAGVGFVNITFMPEQIPHPGFNFRVECYKECVTPLPQGWFDDNDINIYKNLVENIPIGGSMIELGVWKGRSLCSIADTILKRNINVTAIDTFKGSSEEVEAHSEARVVDIEEIFKCNIEKFSLNNNVYILKDDCSIIHKRFIDEKCDLIFIDAGHTYDEVFRDIMNWLPKVKYGGILCGHDYTWKSVRDAVHEIFNSKVEVSNNMWWVTRK